MNNTIYWIVSLLLFYPQLSFGQENVKHQIIAGSENDFMIVRHYRIEGTNREIGQRIAQIAKSLKAEINTTVDSIRNRLRYEYFKQNYRLHYERMIGVADEYGISLKDFSRDVSSISYYPAKANCSVVFFPASHTANKHNIVSRNLDMPIDRIQNSLHIFARPIVFEVYPDTGYASIYICTNDLLGGVLEGINSKGLCVAVLGNETSNYSCHPQEPSYEVGLNEFLSMRYLLDNCANAEEAEQSLLWLKQYYQMFQLHYMVADNDGKSFVFQFSRHRNQSRIIDGAGIQYVTNHLLSISDSSDVPEESLERFNILKSLITANYKYTIDDIRVISSKVSPWMPDYRPRWPSSRTLWHSIYDLDSKTLSIKFYMGETTDPSNKDRVITRYSDYFEFRLEK